MKIFWGENKNLVGGIVPGGGMGKSPHPPVGKTLLLDCMGKEALCFDSEKVWHLLKTKLLGQ